MHGRDDTLVPPAFTSRPYYAQNRVAEGARSKLAYVEVTNAQHFDAFIDLGLLPGYDAMFVPLHHYFLQAMDLMYAHLTANAPLPPSQVVRTTPRGGTPGSAPQIASSNVPPISQNPALFSLLGTMYGGNGQTTFGLPALRGRAALGFGQGPGLSMRTQGEVGGSETVTLTQATLPPHSHTVAASSTATTKNPSGSLPSVVGVACVLSVTSSERPFMKPVYAGSLLNPTTIV